MPESWLNMASDTASNIGTRYLLVNRGSSPCPCSASIDSTISRRSSPAFSSPVRRSTSPASAKRPFFTSQRGLRGMKNSIRKKKADGTAATPSFQRHSSGPNPNCPMT